MAQETTALRAWARGKDCQLRIDPGLICHNDRATTVLCHPPTGAQFKGMAFKPPDILGAIGCGRCHDYVDQRRFQSTQDLRNYYFLQGFQNTILLAWEEGVLTIGQVEC